MPAARAAPSREAPSSTSARASIRRAALASRHRAASRRSSTAPGSFRVIATVMAPPLIGHTADQPRQAPRGSERDDGSAIRAVGISPSRRLADRPIDPLHRADADAQLPGDGLDALAGAPQLAHAPLGPCVRTERCTDLSEKALLFSELLPTLAEARGQ